MDGLLITASPLDDHEVRAIEEKFSKHIGKDVTFRVEVDRSLIGGFIATIRHHRYDYSLKAQLQEMKKHLLDD